MKIWKIGVVFLSTIGLGLGAAACAGGSSPTVRTIHVDVQEWNVKVHNTEVSAGDVMVSVVNRGALEHELVILKTDKATGKLETHSGKVEEDAYGNVGEIEGIAVGEAKSATFHLEPGTYVLLCNIVGHYSAGMHETLIVK